MYVKLEGDKVYREKKKWQRIKQWGAEGRGEGQAAELNVCEYKTFDMMVKSMDSGARLGFKSQHVLAV